MISALSPLSRLTAYVAKVFAMASRLVPIQTSVICDAVKFLILNAQQPDGMFKEVGQVFQRDMIVCGFTALLKSSTSY